MSEKKTPNESNDKGSCVAPEARISRTSAEMRAATPPAPKMGRENPGYVAFLRALDS